MSLWEKIRTDLEKGIKEGMEVVREKAILVKEKTELLTDEGKRRLKIFDLQSQVKHEMTKLGGHVYDLKAKIKNPLTNNRVKAVINRIKKLEDQIVKLEGKTKEQVKKKIAKKLPKRNK